MHPNFLPMSEGLANDWMGWDGMGWDGFLGGIIWKVGSSEWINQKVELLSLKVDAPRTTA